jgi:hypothetical protein
MSTRSTVARRLPDGHWEGRYVHSDGYPSWNGEQVKKLIAMHGKDEVIKTLIDDYYGWSSIYDGQTDKLDSPGMQDGRFVAIKGYGVAYTTETGGLPGGLPQSKPEDWVRDTDDPDIFWLEFAYVIEEDGSVSAYRSVGDGWQEIPKDTSGEWLVEDGE